MYSKGGLSFANEQALFDKLKLLPGSVTPYALLEDTAKEITFILDKDFLNYEMVNFHPLINEATISMSLDSFLQFFDLIDHSPEIIDLPVLMDK